MFNIFDLFDLDPQKVVAFFAKINIPVSVGTVEWGITILIIITVIVIIVGVVSKLSKKWNEILTVISKKRKWRRNYIRDGLEHSYGDYLTPERQRCYVPTQCQGTPPHNFEEPDEAVASSPKEDLVSFFIDTVFKASNTNRMLYCILYLSLHII